MNYAKASEGPLQSLSGVLVGHDVVLGKFINLYGCEIGSHSKIGAFVEIQKDVKVGQRCKISSHTFICSGVEIDDDVFIGHNVTFTNDKHPRAVNERGEPAGPGDWKLQRTYVERGVTIGSGVTILPGLRIGVGATIGAGAVVTHSVLPGVTIVGNPGRYISYV